MTSLARGTHHGSTIAICWKGVSQSIIGDAAAGTDDGAGFAVLRWLGAIGDTAGVAGAGALENRSCDDVRTRAWFEEGKLAGCGGSIFTVGGDGEGSRNAGGGAVGPLA